jgi:hypothetical protein
MLELPKRSPAFLVLPSMRRPGRMPVCCLLQRRDRVPSGAG